MYIAGRSVRAYRPSRCVSHEQFEDDAERDRLANLALYALRAEAGLPLFDQPAAEPAPVQRKRVG
jgi:hypothetical protein